MLGFTPTLGQSRVAIEGAPMDLKLRLIASRTKDACRYNVLTVDEIVTLMVGNGSEVVDRCDVILA